MALLWRLDRPDAPGPSYLFGTMHVRDERAFTRLAPVHAALDSSALFATEFDLGELTATVDQSALYLPDGGRISQLLPPHRYTRLCRILQKAFAFPLPHYDRLRPMIVVNLISERLLARERLVSLDAYLWERANAGGLPTTGLESYAFQQRLLTELPLAQQLRDLLALGRHPGKYKRHTQRLADYYAAGDLTGLYRATRRGAGGMRRVLIFARNARMAERFDELAREQALFAAVGAAHLPGGKGMLRLLKHRGWRVRAVAEDLPGLG